MAKDEATTGEAAEPNTLKDRWGNERKWDGERYPEGSAAREGHITKPSGTGGSTPKARPDHQDMFPANPEPSESAKERGELNDRIEQGEAGVGEVVETKVVPDDARKAQASTRKDAS